MCMKRYILERKKIETNIIGNAKLVKIEKFSNTNLYAYKRKQNVSCT